MYDFNSEDLLSLFAYLIIVDHKIYPEEIEAFAKAGLSLRLRTEDGILMSRRDMIQWFERKYKLIKADANTKEMHEKLAGLFLCLQDMPNKQDVLDWMCVIALADGPVHVNERLILAMAAGHWDLRPPKWDQLHPSIAS